MSNPATDREMVSQKEFQLGADVYNDLSKRPIPNVGTGQFGTKESITHDIEGRQVDQFMPSSREQHDQSPRIRNKGEENNQ